MSASGISLTKKETSKCLPSNQHCFQLSISMDLNNSKLLIAYLAQRGWSIWITSLPSTFEVKKSAPFRYHIYQIIHSSGYAKL